MFKCDNSLLEERAKCIAAAVVKHALHRDSKAFKEAAEVGNAFHTALETHFRGGDQISVMSTFDQEYDRLFPIEKPPVEERFSKANLQIIMEEFVKHNPVAEFPFRPLSFEQVVGFDLCEGVRFYVKRDMLMEEKDSGLQMPLDHKTTKRLTAWWQKKWRFSSQMLGYAWAGGQEMGQVPSHVAVNALEMSLLPRSNYKCRTHKMKYSECYRMHAHWEILKYLIVPEMVEAWKATAILQARQAEVEFAAYGTPEMVKYAPRTGLFTGGCTFCDLKDWCRMDFKPEAMEELTVAYHWAPWDYAVGEVVVLDPTPAVVQEPEVLGAPASQSQEYTWYFNPETGKIWVSKVPLAGFTAMAEPMALKALWQQGRDAWMEVWKTYPFVQERMVEFGRGQA